MRIVFKGSSLASDVLIFGNGARLYFCGELLRDVRLAGEVVFREMPFPARLRVERVDADVRVGYSLQALLQALVVVVVVDDGGRRSGAERLHHPLLRVRPERVQIDAVLGVWRRARSGGR